MTKFLQVPPDEFVPHRAHDFSKVGGTCPPVPHGGGAYAIFSISPI